MIWQQTCSSGRAGNHTTRPARCGLGGRKPLEDVPRAADGPHAFAFNLPLAGCRIRWYPRPLRCGSMASGSGGPGQRIRLDPTAGGVARFRR